MMRSLFVLVFSFLLFVPQLFAADITKIKGTAALIDLKGEPAQPGDLFYAKSADGKNRGIIQIAKIKGDRAIGRITKGRAEVGMTIEPKGSNTPVAAQPTRMKKSSSEGGAKGRSYWGGILGFGMDSMKAKVLDGTTHAFRETVALSGTSFSGAALFDYELFSQIWFRGLGGIEGFNVTGSSVCGTVNNETCNAKLYYLSLDFLGRYIFSEGNFRPWLGGGVGLMFPASKASTALEPSSISNTSVMIVGGGFDYFISPKMYIPFSVEYGLLPKSDEVEATWIEIRMGFAVPF